MQADSQSFFWSPAARFIVLPAVGEPHGFGHGSSSLRSGGRKHANRCPSRVAAAGVPGEVKSNIQDTSTSDACFFVSLSLSLSVSHLGSGHAPKHGAFESRCTLAEESLNSARRCCRGICSSSLKILFNAELSAELALAELIDRRIAE